MGLFTRSAAKSGDNAQKQWGCFTRGAMECFQHTPKSLLSRLSNVTELKAPVARPCPTSPNPPPRRETTVTNRLSLFQSVLIDLLECPHGIFILIPKGMLWGKNLGCTHVRCMSRMLWKDTVSVVCHQWSEASNRWLTAEEWQRREVINALLKTCWALRNKVLCNFVLASITLSMI